MAQLDFNNTEIAFTSKSDSELVWMYRMFRLMNESFITKSMSKVAMLAVKLRLPFHERIIRNTLFKIFCGGISLEDSQALIEQLNKYKVSAVLDYGAEGKSEDDDLDLVLQEILKGITFAAAHENVPVVSTKITALAANQLLIDINNNNPLSTAQNISRTKLLKRLEKIGSLAESLGVKIFIDAEESWMQDAIDELVDDMVSTYNKKQAIIYGTYQLYRKDGMERLQSAYELSAANKSILGAKIVRGAYMDKERARAAENGTTSLINDTKEETDKLYNSAVRFCCKHYKEMASCTATHNLESNLLQAKIMEDSGIAKHHDHLNFCQLLGMSDYITYNLAGQGYNVAKYLVYGPVRDVVPYLVRRAQENTAITDEMSRELQLIKKEMARRGLIKSV